MRTLIRPVVAAFGTALVLVSGAGLAPDVAVLATTGATTESSTPPGEHN
jgi:hypothetical protein